jgi:hypothetical protein
MFRSANINSIFRDMCITRWLENQKEREILESSGADGKDDNIKVHLREI